MVRAAQKGELENPSPEVSKIASTVSKSDVKKMASTKHKGLPEKKEIKEVWGAVAKVAMGAAKGAVKQKAKQVVAQKAANVARGSVPQPNRDQQEAVSLDPSKDSKGGGVVADVEDQAQKKMNQIKKQVLLKKLQAVRSGGGETVTASYQPEGEMTEGVGRAAIGAGIGAMVGGPVGAAVGGSIGAAMGKKKKVTGGNTVKKKATNFFKAEPKVTSSEGVVSFVKKGLERDKKAKKEKDIKNRKAVPYAALGASYQPEGELVDEANKEERTADRYRAGKLSPRPEGKRHQKKNPSWQNRTANVGKRNLRRFSKAHGGDGSRKLNKFGTDWQVDKVEGNSSESSDHAQKQRRAEHEARRGVKTKGVKKEELSIVDKMLIEYSPNVTYQDKKKGKLGKSSIYSLRDKDESKKDFRKSHVKDVEDGYVGKGHKPTPGSLKKEEVQIEAKVDTVKKLDDEGKEDARNTRRYGHVPYNKHGHSVLRRSEHRMRRGDKKRPGHKEVNVETGKVGKEIGEAYRVLAKDKTDSGKPDAFSYKDENDANKFAASIRKKGGKATVQKEGVMDIVKKYRKKQKSEKKPSMDPTTKKLHKWRKDKEHSEREKYVSPFRPIDYD